MNLQRQMSSILAHKETTGGKEGEEEKEKREEKKRRRRRRRRRERGTSEGRGENTGLKYVSKIQFTGGNVVSSSERQSLPFDFFSS